MGSRLGHATRPRRQAGTPIALVALDLDHFKVVDEGSGHLFVDAMLREGSASLIYVVGDRGVVAPLGDEEFAAPPLCARPAVR